MGHKFEIYEWYKDASSGSIYKYHLRLQTESLLYAIFYAWRLKKNGAGCVKIEWR